MEQVQRSPAKIRLREKLRQGRKYPAIAAHAYPVARKMNIYDPEATTNVDRCVFPRQLLPDEVAGKRL